MPIDLFAHRDFDHSHITADNQLLTYIAQKADALREIPLSTISKTANGPCDQANAIIEVDGETKRQPLITGLNLHDVLAYKLADQTTIPNIAFGWSGSIISMINRQTDIASDAMALELDALRTQLIHLVDYRLNETNDLKQYDYNIKAYPELSRILTSIRPKYADNWWDYTTLRHWLDWIIVATSAIVPVKVIPTVADTDPTLTQWFNGENIPLLWEQATRIKIDDKLSLFIDYPFLKKGA